MKSWTPQFKITLSVLALILTFLLNSWACAFIALCLGVSGINQLLDGE